MEELYQWSALYPLAVLVLALWVRALGQRMQPAPA
jgi:hypothetical protein